MVKYDNGDRRSNHYLLQSFSMRGFLFEIGLGQNLIGGGRPNGARFLLVEKSTPD
jgi:hypothetical protein